MPLRYPGTCVACGLALAKGDEALYDSQARTIRCVECPAGDDDHEESKVEVGTAGASARPEYERRKASRENRIRAASGSVSAE